MADSDLAAWVAETQKRVRDTLERLRAVPARPKPLRLTSAQLAAMIDHTALKADTTADEIDRLCAEARECRFASVCVNSCNVARCARALEGTDILVCSVVGFPLGANLTDVKAFETRRALQEGAREIDMVLNIGALVAGDYALVREDVARVVEVCHQRDAACKVIIETALLTDEEKVAACLLAVEAGADYCKTSTGFGPGGATIRDVALMRAVVGPQVGVKAAGGIRTYEDAMAMIGAGANRLGASAGVSIIRGAPEQCEYADL